MENSNAVSWILLVFDFPKSFWYKQGFHKIFLWLELEVLSKDYFHPRGKMFRSREESVVPNNSNQSTVSKIDQFDEKKTTVKIEFSTQTKAATNILGIRPNSTPHVRQEISMGPPVSWKFVTLFTKTWHIHNFFPALKSGITALKILWYHKEWLFVAIFFTW